MRAPVQPVNSARGVAGQCFVDGLLPPHAALGALGAAQNKMP